MSIDRYDPIRVLGEGSFGKVYLMRDKVKRNFVCVKIIKIKNIPKKEREATRMEVDLLKRLHHPNIVGYIDSFLSKNSESLCICMEYCDGGDLASQIKAAKRNLFSESKILHWFVQLALGLQYMHGLKVLHRDLKTQNVFMLGNGRLVLGDLGISKVLDGTMDFAQTCIGTPYYMSPEIFKNKPYSYKSDVWALGCVLYEMTTLNHAFDANSLNGLAAKIVKGKYPPIHSKYSRHLKELIEQMLMLNPQQRPDLNQILRKPFIKKHIVNFFVDIASRPSASLGEGTMILKAAAGGGGMGSVMNDPNMTSLRQQLQSLDMMDAVTEALKPKSNPQDDQEALRLAKEQASALKREQEHKKMVEAALEKLRLEREARAKQRSDPPKAAAGAYPLASKNPPAPSRAEPVSSRRPAAAPVAAPLSNRGANEAFRKEAKEAIGVKDRQEQARLEEANARKRAMEEREREKLALVEREKRAAEERRKAQEEQDILKRKVEERRREQEAKAREDARQREEIRLREEAKAQEELLRDKAEQAARARRETQREKERERQRQDIEQLKRDKLELDRRAMERDRLRDERRAQEQARIENLRREQLDIMQEKLDYMNDQVQKLDLPGAGGRGNYQQRAEEKNGGEDYLSAREKVYLRRQEKQAKEEAERLDALRQAENENRRIRAIAQQEHRNKVYGDNNAAPMQIGNPNRPRGSDPYAAAAADEFDPPKPKPSYEPSKGRSRNSMGADELSERLEEATRGKGVKYDPFAPVSEAADRKSAALPPRRNEDAGNKAQSDWGNHSDSGSDGEEIFNQDSANPEEEDEDMYRREEELRAELNFATLRVEELRKTLQETKSFLGPRLPTRGKETVATSAKPAPSQQSAYVEEDQDDDDDDEDLYSLDEEEQEQWDDSPQAPAQPAAPARNAPTGGQGPQLKQKSTFIPRTEYEQYENDGGRGGFDGADATIRRVKPESAIPHSKYGGVQEPPSPSGKLADRIESLRQKCIQGLGREAYLEAYNFLLQHDLESLGYENGRDMNDDDYEAKKLAGIRSILGEQKLRYLKLIEQILFMEGAVGD